MFRFLKSVENDGHFALKLLYAFMISLLDFFFITGRDCVLCENRDKAEEKVDDVNMTIEHVRYLVLFRYIWYNRLQICC